MQAREETSQQLPVLPLERRKEPRRKAAIHAFVSGVHNGVELKCMIRDISRGGCRIASSYIQDLPRVVRIMPEGFEKPLTGKIVWRNAKVAGVQFLSDGECAELDPDTLPGVREAGPGGFFARLQAMVGLRRSAGIARRGELRARSGLPDFRSSVLHGLRNPMTAVKSLLSLLNGDAVRPIPRRARSVIKAAHQNAERAERLLGEALRAHKLDSGQLPCKPVPVEIVELVRDAALANTGFAAKYDVRFDVCDDVGEASVRADPARIEDVLANLLSAAASYSPVGETVTVSLTREYGAIRVTVADRGTGADVHLGDADGKHVSHRHDDDHALGLGICRAILRKHGSKLHMEARPGSGTAMWFELREIA